MREVEDVSTRESSENRESLIIDKPACRRCDPEVTAKARHPANPDSRVLHPKDGRAIHVTLARADRGHSLRAVGATAGRTKVGGRTIKVAKAL
jgi:hypothetical protein